MDRLLNIALKIAHNQGVFTYRLRDAAPDKDYVGLRVRVTIKNRPTVGVIIGESQEALDPKVLVKDIIEIIDSSPIITQQQLDLMRFCANYYFNPLGTCVHLAVPKNDKAPRVIKEKNLIKKSLDELSEEQHEAVEKILSQDLGAYLLEGVTGSGKTHVYIKVAEATLKQGRSVLFLVPEISLTPQLVERVQAALGQKVHVIHSNISPAQKRDTIFALLEQSRQVLIGARSAIFAPLKNLGLIVVDEEHDASLKQDESPRYHARDLALWRAKNEGARIILGTATPSLESVVNVQKNKLLHIKLEKRYGHERLLPEVVVIDLKQRSEDVDFRTKDQAVSQGQKMCILARPLVEEMRKTLANKAQVLLFLNQRGYAKFGVCFQCGHMVECPNCSVSLTYYQQRKTMQCHQCQHIQAANTTCQNCRHESVRFLGLGTERLEEEVRTLFPDHKIVRLDRDVVQSQQRLEATLAAMHDQEADILIGTQMVTKGHDFLHVGLVGVVCADVALSMPDFRAAEKTFQLLTQVAGRAGRGEILGKAIIQTFNPEHPSILFAQTHNVKDFIAQELFLRKRFMQPPFTRAALIRCEHKELATAEAVMEKAKNLLSSTKKMSVLGPVPSPIEKISLRFRFQCLALAHDAQVLHGALATMMRDKALGDILAKKQPRFIIDVDPQNMS
jgi:primosomal protein N' (replication factor Y) (superfamily II helicase)